MLRFYNYIEKTNDGVEGEPVEPSHTNTVVESQPFQKKQKKNVIEGEPFDTNNSNMPCSEVASEKYAYDPGNHPLISTYHPNVQDEIHRYYLLNDACQPEAHVFPTSIKDDAAYCLPRYIFKQGGENTFVTTGFRNWGKKNIIANHVGGLNSAHNKAQRNCDALQNQEQHIETILSNQTSQDRLDYQTRLSASIGVVRILLKQALPFRGHDKYESSNNLGNFLEILEWLCSYNEDIQKVTLKNAPENLKLTSPDIQNDIVSTISIEIVNRIAHELGDSLFAIIVDESRDMSCKEQMAIVLRYVDAGKVIEHFVGVEHVTNTNDVTLKATIDDFLCRTGKVCQGYEVKDMMEELQLTLVAVAKNHTLVSDFFTLVSNVVNVVGASAKRRDILREKHGDNILEALENNELSTVLKVVREDGTSSEQKLEVRVLIGLYGIIWVHLLSTFHEKCVGSHNDLSKALQKKD
ncbi:uncharacterized protein LOC126787371 [Argentina anserina]|uniref:uncharacterized protein LOC126787371 n=1 Tax=Argentina anserina TaxID=57926 RepID=UPI0021765D8A|nr:uncharacterized protein LOC126787371 [Potentilla anserina]